jgi:ribonuclease HII
VFFCSFQSNQFAMPIALDYFELTLEGIAIAGVDEVGRGALIGPVVTAAVLLQAADCPALIAAGVQDSKKLSAKRREELFPLIQASVGGYCIASASAAEIDQINIRRATLLAMRRAIQGLSNPPELCLIDGRDAIPELDIPQQTLIGGDNRSVAIAAASILAKVSRDRLLIALADQYPQYGLERHKGYGTAQHRTALQAHGPTPEHRRSFLSKILDLTEIK